MPPIYAAFIAFFPDFSQKSFFFLRRYVYGIMVFYFPKQKLILCATIENRHCDKPTTYVLTCRSHICFHIAIIIVVRLFFHNIFICCREWQKFFRSIFLFQRGRMKMWMETSWLMMKRRLFSDDSSFYSSHYAEKLAYNLSAIIEKVLVSGEEFHRERFVYGTSAMLKVAFIQLESFYFNAISISSPDFVKTKRHCSHGLNAFSSYIESIMKCLYSGCDWSGRMNDEAATSRNA